MAKYDYECARGHVFETDRPMADRHKRIVCQCGATGTLLFTPSGNNVIPGSFGTRWADVAPLAPNGQPMSFTETVKSGLYDRFDKSAREDAEKATAAHEAHMEPIIRQRAKDRAWKKVKAAEKRGLKVRTAEKAVA